MLRVALPCSPGSLGCPPTEGKGRQLRHDVVIVHDYLTQRGGAERVVLSMLEAFPDAPVVTALYEPTTTFPEFSRHRVDMLWPDRVPGLRADHRRGLPLYPAAFGRATMDAEVTLCSSSGFAHGVRATGRKVVYCHAPARWLYDQAPEYLAGWPAPLRTVVRAAAPLLRRWDQRAASSADAYLTNSRAMRDRIARVYGRDADVVPPAAAAPVVREAPRAVPGLAPGFFLVVSRLMTYKNVDAIVDAFASLPDEHLVVVGTGPERARLAARAGVNVTFLGTVDDAQLAWAYEQCAALVAASYEDYGLTPLEAAAHGKPVAVLRYGGFLDTVRDGETGVFFDEPRAESVAGAVRAVAARTWDFARIRAHAAEFDERHFCARLRDAVGRTAGSIDERAR